MKCIMADSTSVNLFKLLVAALESQPDRHKIVTDDLNFPSDLYILQGAAGCWGGKYQIVVVPSPDGVYGPVEGWLRRLMGKRPFSPSPTPFSKAATPTTWPRYRPRPPSGRVNALGPQPSAGAVPMDLNGAQC
jgi:kynureninase